MSLSNFQYGCLGIPTHHLGPLVPTNHNGSQPLNSYSSSLVYKAIHLVRDPLDNIVSRFHLAYKKLPKKDQELYTRDDIGFQRFCHYWDSWQLTNSSRIKRKRRNHPSDNISLFIQLPWKPDQSLTLADVENVPCWADFFRFVNWHNNAFHVQSNLHLPSLILYYEEYEDDWTTNMNHILQFLNQTKATVKGKQGKVHPFQKGKGYHHYFRDDQKKAIWTLIEKVSLPETWQLLQRYQVE
jgi:hypothetical protein